MRAGRWSVSAGASVRRCSASMALRTLAGTGTVRRRPALPRVCRLPVDVAAGQRGAIGGARARGTLRADELGDARAAAVTP